MPLVDVPDYMLEGDPDFALVFLLSLYSNTSIDFVEETPQAQLIRDLGFGGHELKQLYARLDRIIQFDFDCSFAFSQTLHHYDELEKVAVGEFKKHFQEMLSHAAFIDVEELEEQEESVDPEVLFLEYREPPQQQIRFSGFQYELFLPMELPPWIRI